MKALDKNNEEYTEAVRQGTLRGLDQLLAQNPDDVFLHIDYINTKKGESRREYDEIVERYKALLNKHPGNSEYEFLYALALVDTNTAQAIQRLKAISAAAPVAPQVHLALAEIHHWGKFADQSVARADLDAFLDACPGSLNSQARSFAREIATPEVAAKYAVQLRSRLEKEKDPAVLSAWESVWKLEFVAEPEKADTVRARVKDGWEKRMMEKLEGPETEK
jgi:predicted Zn-dependent protease